MVLITIFLTWLGALAAVVCAAGVWLVQRQLQLSAWTNVQEIYMDPDFTKARTTVLKHFKDPNYEKTPQDEDDAKLVCRRMDGVAWLVRKKLISKNEAHELWGLQMGKCWVVVEKRWEIVSKERSLYGPKDKWKAFYDLGREEAQHHQLI